MKLSTEFCINNDKYSLLITIQHKNLCILRSTYNHYLTHESANECINELHSKLSDLYLKNKPCELFSDSNVYFGSSLSISFAKNAFLYAHSILPTNMQDVTTNNIFTLTNQEVMQFYCEINRLLESIISVKRMRMTL